jgi:phenylalanyl-tRNA synthetase beta chain
VRVPINWLQELVPVEIPVDELVSLLNFSGTKVEAVHRSAGSIAGVIAAKVISIEPHPNADNLTLVVVETGNGTERVVCGARNFAVGDLVPFATVGARLPDMSITERKIRGEVSRGMLCSGRELGVGRDHSGILVLPPDSVLGEDVSTVLGLNDTIIELELTPNRPDCMGMIGIAREVAALTGAAMTWPDTEVAAGDVASPVSVEIRDAQGCPRYMALYVAGVAVAPSPAWMTARLLASGVRPVSNVVDATNYVMLEIGHPLHPFDAANVADGCIVVRRAADGEEMTTLDGVSRRLSAADLLIAGRARPLALAGVMGGEDSEVSANTSEIILEAAYFDPASIALTSRRHQLRSEASARFERGMDPEVVPAAAARACRLIMQVAGGATSKDVVDQYPVPIIRSRIRLRTQRTDALLGIHVDAGRQASLLESVGFGVAETDEGLSVQPPSFRPDVTREVDLIEEVARLEGLDKLSSTLPDGGVGGLDDEQSADRAIRRTLAGLGLHEAWTTSFMSPRDPGRLGLDVDLLARDAIEVANPMSEEEKLLRTSLLPGLLQAARHNLARGSGGAALFEIARVYGPDGEPLPAERTMLAGVFSGRRREQGWNASALGWDFFAVKGIVTGLLESLRVPPPGFTASTAMPFHPTRGALLSWGDTSLGVLGELHPDVCDAFEVAAGTVAFEMPLAPVLAALPGRSTAGSLPRYPAILIDLAIVVDVGQDEAAVEDAIRSAGGSETRAVRLFDVYMGPQVPDGKKSLAFALELQVPERTLTDQDAGVVKERIMQELEERFGARLRT